MASPIPTFSENQTQSLYTLPDVLSVDSRLTVASQKQIVIRKGAANNTVQRTTASSLSNAQVIYNVQLGSAVSTIIDPYMYQEIQFNVTVNASGLSQTVQNYVTDLMALRQYPISSVTNTLTVQINGQQITCTPSQFIHELGWYQDFLNGSDQQSVQSIIPIMPDQAPTYSQLNGSSKSPLLGYVSGGEQYSEARGSFNSIFTTVTSTDSAWNFLVTIREPLMIPVLDYELNKDREGMPYINVFNVQVNFLSNLSRILSLDLVNAPAVTSIVANIQSATLVQNWLTAPTNLALPELYLRSYNNIVCNQTLQTSMAPGASNVLQSQSYSMSQIPKKLWVYVKRSNVDTATGYQYSDFTFNISAITVLFNNRAGLLSNWSTVDIYNNNAQEGCKYSFVQNQEFTGTVIQLDPVLLFSLLNDETAGLLGNYNLQVQVTANNISPTDTITPTLYVVWAMDSIISINKDFVSNITQGFITSRDVMAASNLPALPGNFASENIYGGAFLDRLKKFGRNAVNFVKSNKLISKAIPYVGSLIPGAAPFIGPAQQIAESLGVGYYDEPRRPRKVRGGGKTSRKAMLSKSLRY
jgi:hypothetical protein